jgi:hypothetical protein
LWKKSTFSALVARHLISSIYRESTTLDSGVLIQSRLSYVTLQRTSMKRSHMKGSLLIQSTKTTCQKKCTFSHHSGINVQCNACISDFLKSH